MFRWLMTTEVYTTFKKYSVNIFSFSILKSNRRVRDLGFMCVSVMFGHNFSIFVHNYFGTTTSWKGRNQLLLFL